MSQVRQVLATDSSDEAGSSCRVRFMGRRMESRFGGRSPQDSAGAMERTRWSSFRVGGLFWLVTRGGSWLATLG